MHRALHKISPLLNNAHKEYASLIGLRDQTVKGEMAPSIHKIPPIIREHLKELPQIFQELNKLQEIVRKYESNLRRALECSEKVEGFNGQKTDLIPLLNCTMGEISLAIGNQESLVKEIKRMHKEISELK